MYRYTCQESRVDLLILWPDLSVGIRCSLQPSWDTSPKPQHTTPQCPLTEVTQDRWSLTAGHQVHDGEYPHQETKEARVMWSGKLFLVVRMTSAEHPKPTPLRFYFPQWYNFYPNFPTNVLIKGKSKSVG